jgi:hypothetical protein
VKKSPPCEQWLNSESISRVAEHFEIFGAGFNVENLRAFEVSKREHNLPGLLAYLGKNQNLCTTLSDVSMGD